MSYPSSIDSFTNPSGTSRLDNPDHATQHVNTNTAIIAMQTVMGTTAGTAVLKNIQLGGFASSTSGTETLTNKTINSPVIGTPTINVGSDAPGDMYYRNASGAFSRFAAGTAATGKYLTTDGTTPSWGTVTSAPLNLQSIVQTNLSVAFNAGTGTAEQEVTGMRVSLPIISGGTACTVESLLKVYYTTVSGDNTLRVRLGTSTSYLTNSEKDNLYVSGAKTLETFTGVVVVGTVDLTVQNYVVVSVQNATNASGLSLSSSGARSTIVTKVYK